MVIHKFSKIPRTLLKAFKAFNTGNRRKTPTARDLRLNCERFTVELREIYG